MSTAAPKPPLESFLELYWKDREAGAVRTLGEYLDLFPGDEEGIALEFLALQRGDGRVWTLHGPGARIGSYDIIRELGRGGQATVYLAEDSTLGRKVALKVLEGIGPAQADVIARFRREALAASALQHPGICAVFEAKVDAKVPYIAMQYVEGETLARKIASTKEKRSPATEGNVLTQAERHLDQARDSATTVVQPQDRAAITEAVRIIEKGARALHVAHEAGITHRDIKPGNIMVTPAGDPVILDFGLARQEDSDLATLTRTGDLFGTPAYMSPEQLTRQSIRLDRRTDVWSLGVSLYESLLLQRPFAAPTQEKLYEAILTREPEPLRRHNPAIPKDLAVVVATALEKDRARRYQTALELAEDLGRFLRREPIHARPVGQVGRLVRWASREPLKATLLLVLLVTLPTIAALATAYVKDMPEREQARLLALQQEKDELLADASYELGEGDPRRARVLFEKVLGMEGATPEAATGLVLTWLKLGDPKAALGVLDRVAPQLAGRPAAVQLRADALRDLGQEAEAAELEKAITKPKDALDHHTMGERALRAGEAGKRGSFEEAVAHARRAVVLSPSPRLHLTVLWVKAAGWAHDRDAAIEATAVLRLRWPHSVMGLFNIGFALEAIGDQDLLDDAISAYREALPKRPDDATAYNNLGNALWKKRLIDDAIVAYRESIRLKPDDARVHSNLGNALKAKNRLPEAIAAYREAIGLMPELALAHSNLGAALSDTGRLQDAVAAYREAIRLEPNLAEAHTNLGNALKQQGLLDDAIGAFHDAIRVKQDFVSAHINLGNALVQQGLLDDAIAAYREAIRLEPGEALAHYNLGLAYVDKRLIDDAIAAYREAIKFNPGLAKAHCELGQSLRTVGEYREALDALRRGNQLGTGEQGWKYPSAQWVAEVEALIQAENELVQHLTARTEPEAPEDLVRLAEVALPTGRVHAAAQWYQRAFERDQHLAGLLREGHRFHAARAAVRASGSDALAPEARAEWRSQALKWLNADLDDIEVRIAEERIPSAFVYERLTDWKKEADLVPVRLETGLATLSPEERNEWTKLWARVAFLLEEASK